MKQIKKTSLLVYILTFITFVVGYCAVQYLFSPQDFVWQKELSLGVPVGIIVCFIIYYSTERKLGNIVKPAIFIAFLLLILVASNLTDYLVLNEEYKWQKTSFVVSLVFVIMATGMYLLIKPKKELMKEEYFKVES